MKLFIFAVKDRATEVFGSPMFLISTGQAVRGFSDEVNRADKENALYGHPDDFDLYSLGSFDNEAGEFEAVRPQVVARGKDVSLKFREES